MRRNALSVFITLLLAIMPAAGLHAQSIEDKVDTTIVLFVYADFLKSPVEHCEIDSISATEIRIFAGFGEVQIFQISDFVSVYVGESVSPISEETGCVFWLSASLAVEDHYFGSMGGDTMEGGSIRDVERNGFLFLAINRDGGQYGLTLVDDWSLSVIGEVAPDGSSSNPTEVILDPVETKEASQGSETTTSEGDEIIITASDDFTFNPNEIQVAPGQVVTLVNEGFLKHSLVSEALGLNTDLIGNGESKTFTIPDDATAGESFEFNCNVPGHEQSGMTGTFTIVAATGTSSSVQGNDDEVSALSTTASLEATIEAQENQIADLEATVEAQATRIAELETTSTDADAVAITTASDTPKSETSPSDSRENQSFTIEGTLTLFDEDVHISGNSCFGSRGYNDIHDGTQVVINDGDGNLLGVGRLEYSDSIRGVGCEFNFKVEVESTPYYRIQITHRGEMIYTFDELEENNWEVALSLGN